MERKGRKRYRVRLSAEERAELSGIVNGKAAAHRRKHAHMLLLADEDREDGGRTDADIASVLGVGASTVERVRKRCVEEGLEAAVERRKQVNRKPRKLDGAGEAKLVALACSAPPEGHARWTLRLLGDKLVELEIVDSIHKETVRKARKKNNVKPWRKQCWCIPPKASAESVCAMEDVLEVYHREFDEDTVLVCMDETSKQQTKETRTPRPARPGQPAVVDFEYERNGVANLFMVFAPLLGWRWVKVTDRRTRHDWAHLIRELVDDIFPGKNIVLVMDNLNIHSLASLYEAFEPAEARRIAERLEIHYTPKHGSWLNLAEIEIGVLARQCLARRIPDRERLCRETGAWQAKRNRKSASVDWRFKTDDARIKLKSLYPSIQ